MCDHIKHEETVIIVTLPLSSFIVFRVFIFLILTDFCTHLFVLEDVIHQTKKIKQPVSPSLNQWD